MNKDKVKKDIELIFVFSQESERFLETSTWSHDDEDDDNLIEVICNSLTIFRHVSSFKSNRFLLKMETLHTET